jgi:hypothetical protein
MQFIDMITYEVMDMLNTFISFYIKDTYQNIIPYSINIKLLQIKT